MYQPHTALAIVISVLALLLLLPSLDFAQTGPVVNLNLHNIQSGHLVVVGSDQNAPFSFLDSNGQPAGHDIDIMRAIADHLNVTVEFRLESWFRSQNDLRDGQADILLTLAFIPERKKEFELTIPIFTESHALFARRDNNYQDFSSLKDMKIGVEASDTTVFQLARSLDLVRNLVFVENLEVGFAELGKGGIDVMITNYSSGAYLKRTLDGFVVVGSPLSPNFYSLAVQKGKRELLDDLNHTIDFLKNSGAIKAINDKWLPIRNDDDGNLMASPVFRYAMMALAGSCILVFWLLAWGYVMFRQVRQRTHELRQMVVERTQELERQAQFRRVLRESNLTIFDIDITGDGISGEYHDLMGVKERDMPVESSYDKALVNFTPMVYSDDQYSFLAFFSRKNLLLLSENGSVETFFEFRKQDDAGHWIWVRATVSPWVDTTSSSVRAIVRVKDIDQEKRNLLRIKWQAERDTLTGLYNRNSAETLISQILRDSDGDRTHGFCILDLDNFKAVNDTFGHGEGDLLLIETGHMLMGQFRSVDVIARLGGDEFIVFCRDCSRDLMMKRVQSILASMNSIATKRPQTPVTFSIGIALYPTNGATFADLYKAADEALYKTKRNGKNGYCLHGSDF